MLLWGLVPSPEFPRRIGDAQPLTLSMPLILN